MFTKSERNPCVTMLDPKVYPTGGFKMYSNKTMNKKRGSPGFFEKSNFISYLFDFKDIWFVCKSDIQAVYFWLASHRINGAGMQMFDYMNVVRDYVLYCLYVKKVEAFEFDQFPRPAPVEGNDFVYSKLPTEEFLGFLTEKARFVAALPYRDIDFDPVPVSVIVDGQEKNPPLTDFSKVEPLALPPIPNIEPGLYVYYHRAQMMQSFLSDFLNFIEPLYEDLDEQDISYGELEAYTESNLSDSAKKMLASAYDAFTYQIFYLKK